MLVEQNQRVARLWIDLFLKDEQCQFRIYEASVRLTISFDDDGIVAVDVTGELATEILVLMRSFFATESDEIFEFVEES